MVDEAQKNQILKAQAVRQAMVEVIGEQRDEILKRARAKLIAMGIEFSDNDPAMANMPQGVSPD